MAAKSWSLLHLYEFNLSWDRSSFRAGTICNLVHSMMDVHVGEDPIVCKILECVAMASRSCGGCHAVALILGNCCRWRLGFYRLTLEYENNK